MQYISRQFLTYRVISVIIYKLKQKNKEVFMKWQNMQRVNMKMKHYRERFHGDVLDIEVLPHSFSVCKVEDYSDVNLEDEFCFTGKTDGEKSLVCLTDKVPANTTERADGWRAFRIAGSLDFSLVGILADISGILAEREVSIFALSTFDTDYILVKEQNLQRAVNALRREGYSVIEIWNLPWQPGS